LVEIASTPEEVVGRADVLLQRPRDEWLRNVDAHLSRMSWDRTWAAMRREIDQLLTRAPRHTSTPARTGEEARV
jgi:chromatin segregation and condensation protein Rec8/ScpA/Scc1 (kleisin family)